jgi:hypothetical protein
MERRDHALDSLLDLDGQIIALSDEYWVKFEARLIPQSGNRPHGIKYSLTLHNRKGERIIGYDNAHKIPGNKDEAVYDHKHHIRHKNRVKEYRYESAGKLITDFWKDIDDILNEE